MAPITKEVKRILIVDDNESIHQDFRKVLRGKENRLKNLEAEIFGDEAVDLDLEGGDMPYSYQIDDAFQGEEALQMVEKAEAEGRPYSLIFMDVRMPPGMDGIQTIAEIWKRYPDKELVLCTAYSDYSWNKMLAKIGMTDKLQFIRKPFDMVSVQQLALSLTKKWDLNQKGKLYIKQLEKENKEKERAQKELASLNAELEQRIQERTSEIRKANDALRNTLDHLRQTREVLVENEKMAALGNLVAGIAHEINTPVGIGVTATSHLAEEAQDIHKKYNTNNMRRSDLEGFLSVCLESSEMILSNLNRASRLIQSFKKVAVDQSSEDRRRFNVGRYLEEVMISLRPRLKSTNIDIQIDCPEDIELDSYPGAFSQIISNCVINSLTHAFEPKERGRIDIQIRRAEGGVRLVYQDNGKGIPSKNLKKIFDPFFTTKRGKGGSGLGLHIVYNIVTQNLGGHIECDSEPDRGAKFTIDIPCDSGKGR